ncbi:MAG: tyrosine-type recombinase/integrase [Solirubrobacterales bacterium]|nr:tyrosine-type recombinase/integrase [Solirubrobacterales bacterium]
MSTPLAPTLEAFFTDRLLCQQRVSPNTIASYRDTFRLLLGFVQKQTGTRPARLELTQLDAPTVGAFLEHLETQRGNSARTRNVRLAAVHSFFNYCALRHPEHAALIARVLAIPAKRSEKRIVTFLNPEEVKALLRSPDRTTWAGRRDHALLLTAVQTGLRVSELLALTCGDVQLGTGAHLRTLGKGRKERIAPLTSQTVAVLRVWTRERGGQPADPLFPTRTGTPLTRDAVERRLAKHLHAAQRNCPTLRSKRVSMHVLRHTTAMMLLTAGIDTSTIALWLGHEQERTTHIYLHADLALKQRALDRATPPNGRPGRYRAPDSLLAFLDTL